MSLTASLNKRELAKLNSFLLDDYSLDYSYLQKKQSPCQLNVYTRLGDNAVVKVFQLFKSKKYAKIRN